MEHRNYDYVRFVYGARLATGYRRDNIEEAAKAAIAKAKRYTGDFGLGHAFRVVDNTYASSDPWGDGDIWYHDTYIELFAFPIVKLTPCGFRIRRGGSEEKPEERFVSHGWNKRWAALTVEEAVRDFIARRKRQASIYEARAKKARGLVQKAEGLLGDK